MKIIVVDDESDALGNFLAGIVDENDVEYKMFRNDPQKAVEYAKQNHVDAAFLDVQMPRINGIELAELLTKQRPDLRIVFITGYAQDENAIKERLAKNFEGFCYKPYKHETLQMLLKKISAGIGKPANVQIRTFGVFDLLLDGKPQRFSSAKAKELLALLVEKNGASAGMYDVICALWPDKNLEHAKLLYRDAVWRLRHALKGFGLERLVFFSRACQAINKESAACDYWDFLTGKNRELYSGSFLQNYDWSMETQTVLDAIMQKGENS